MNRIRVACINWGRSNWEAPHAHLTVYDAAGTITKAEFYPTWQAAMDRADQIVSQWRRP